MHMAAAVALNTPLETVLFFVDASTNARDHDAMSCFSQNLPIPFVTSFITLENVFYALMGSIPAIVLYGLVRDPILTAMFGLDEQIGSLLVIPKLSPVLVMGVVLMAIAIECLIPLKSILKALKTPIRDIIFDNRDTEYRYGKSALVVGLILLAQSMLLLKKNITTASASVHHS